MPGLPAKPVIDAQVSVPEVAALDPYAPGLEALGFLHRPHPEIEEARELFRPEGPRVVHVNVVQAGPGRGMGHGGRAAGTGRPVYGSIPLAAATR